MGSSDRILNQGKILAQLLFSGETARIYWQALTLTGKIVLETSKLLLALVLGAIVFTDWAWKSWPKVVQWSRTAWPRLVEFSQSFTSPTVNASEAESASTTPTPPASGESSGDEAAPGPTPPDSSP